MTEREALDDVRAYVVAHRGDTRASLLGKVLKGVMTGEATTAVRGSLVVLWMRELDGDRISARATVAWRQNGHDASWIPRLLVWYRRVYLTLIEDEGSEEGDGSDQREDG